MDQKTLKALDEAAANAGDLFSNSHLDEKEVSNNGQNPSSLLNEENLEDFFSDEDENGISTVENLHGVMKRVSKKAAMMIEGINHC